jgi:hypothetical protein
MSLVLRSGPDGHRAAQQSPSPCARQRGPPGLSWPRMRVFYRMFFFASSSTPRCKKYGRRSHLTKPVDCPVDWGRFSFCWAVGNVAKYQRVIFHLCGPWPLRRKNWRSAMNRPNKLRDAQVRMPGLSRTRPLPHHGQDEQSARRGASSGIEGACSQELRAGGSEPKSRSALAPSRDSTTRPN